MRETHCSNKFWTQFLSQNNNHGEIFKMTVELNLYFQIVRNQEMGHSTKGQSGQMGKTNEKIMYIAKKSPRQNPHLIEKEIKE
jgi:hypothetical protein